MFRMRTLELDSYVVETLLPDLVGHDRRPSAFLVYLALAGRPPAKQEHARVSLRDLSELTGLSKRTVQEALRVLSRRRLVAISREGATEVASYEVKRPWRRGAR
jgi:transcription initiation factor IIE alpha subunit